LSLGLAGGSSAQIEIDGTMDVQDLRAAINAVSATTGISANVMTASATDVRLVLTATDTGKEVTLANVAGDDVLGILGLSNDGGATFANSLSDSQTSRVLVDGVPITRTTNTINDAIDGMTLNLFREEPQTTVTVEVERSLGGIKEQVRGFVDAYNAFRAFVSSHSAVSETGEIANDAVLFGDPLLRSTAHKVASLLTASVVGVPVDAVNALAGLGISLDGSNRLKIDEAKLDGELLADINAVRNVFEFRFSTDSPNLRVLSHTSALSATSFDLTIIDADNDGVPESVSAGGTALDVQGNQIVDRDGTAYAGLQMLWTGRGSIVINVTATQGVADKLYNVLEGMTDDFNGTSTKAVDDLAQRNTAYQSEIERIDASVERYRQQLIDRFGTMETALSLAKAMLDQVRATVAAYDQNR
jgi:flagellar hook-associated protein 2